MNDHLSRLNIAIQFKRILVSSSGQLLLIIHLAADRVYHLCYVTIADCSLLHYSFHPYYQSLYFVQA